jgi:hypothetical protein
MAREGEAMNKHPIEDEFQVYIEGLQLVSEERLSDDAVEAARATFFAGAVATMRVFSQAMKNDNDGRVAAAIDELRAMHSKMKEVVRRMRHYGGK